MSTGSILDAGPAAPQAPQLPTAAAPTASLLTPSAAPPAPVIPVAAPVTYRSFGDAKATREAIYANVLNATREFAPVANNQYTLSLQNVDYDGRDNFSKAEQKRALLTGATLGRTLRGDWVLNDTTGAEVARKRALLARVPHLTERGTYVVNGSEYSMANQLRLRPGIYTRQQANGELEAHVNVAKGRAHKLFLDPETGIYRIKIGQARIPLVPLLKAMGVTDKQLRENWGDLAAVNLQKSDPRAIKKLYEKVKSTGKDTDEESQAKAVADAFQQMELDPEVTKRTLGEAFDRVGPASILATTRKLLRVSRGEEEPDDRDAMAYQKLMGPEDLFAERIKKAQNIARALLWKSTARRNIDHIPAGALTNALQHTLTMSGLGQALEETNTAEILDHQSRVTRRGEGGIQDASAIPRESRAVQPSQLGLIDYLRTPESLSAGIDVRLARNTMKGSDGRLYTKVINAKTGELETKSAQDMNDSTLAFSGELQSGKPYVQVLQNSKIRTVPREQVDFELPDTESSFSPLGNLIPNKSMVKGQRSVMGSRFITQAMPLVNAEAPLVQSGIPGQQDRSFEQEYGVHMGALRSPQAGVVTKVTPDAIQVKYADGTKETHELYQNFGFNRKTSLHQTPVVQPGQQFNQGDLLARSNFTDNEGTTALGMNARVAYLPDDGHNYEDAISISESFAKRMRSEHAYTQQHEWEPGDHQGKKAFISMFPSEYDKRQLANFDDSGVVKEGTTLRFGDPMILIAGERERNKKSLVRSRSSFSNKSITWDHHSPGIVTDVVQTAKGPTVVAKSYAEMNVADKLAGRYGDKGVISRIIPDDQMPVAADGKPVEVLINPLGITSRTNPAQVVESALGKIAAITGKPFRIPDFQNQDDMVEFALKELEKYGMEDTETITLHDGTKVPGVPVGNRWMMKLHHMSDDKIQGRGLGAYSSEGTPAKGGQEGGKSKRVGMLEQTALLSHGSVNVIKEDMRIKGQSSPEYWARYMSGYKPETPRVPWVYNKFVNQLRASGINVVRQGERTHIMALTKKAVDDLVGDREITNAETVNWKNMEPVKGGLFDPTATGGHGGTAGGGCFHPSVKVWTDRGMLAIGDIVRGRLKVSVWSFNFTTRKFELQPITGWFENSSPEGIGAAVFKTAGRMTVTAARTNPSTLWGTRQHAVYNIDGDKIELAAATKLTAVVEQMTYSQTQLLYGTLLGDGHVKEAGQYSAAHCVRQAGWLQFKYDMLAEFCVKPPKHYVDNSGGITREKVLFTTQAHAVFHAARELCYVGKRKILSQKWLDKIDVLGLAAWVLDDGSTRRAKNKRTLTVVLCTDSFSAVEIELLQQWLLCKWGLTTSLYRDNTKYGGRDCGWHIHVIGESADALLDTISPYVPSCMLYKLAVRPQTKLCVCNKELPPTKTYCNACALSRAAAGMPGSAIWKFGTQSAVTKMLRDNHVPPDPDDAAVRRWECRIANAGTAITAVLQDTQLSYGLQEIPCSYRWKAGRSWERTTTVYDIEVANNHNYVANGILVSNSKWSFIRLHTPLPNPVMEEPIRHILGLTQNKLQDIIAGKEQLNGVTGPQAIGAALDKINLPRALENTRADIASGKKTVRDKAIRKLGYLKTLERLGGHPRDWMLDKVPVLPPAFRPVSVMGAKKLPLVADPNYLYKDLFQLNQIYGTLAKDLDPTDLGDEQAAVYNAFKAVTGLGDPVGKKNQERGVKGILQSVFGSSPKYGVMNRKLLSSTVDTVGRAVATPDPDLTMDEAGIPEEAAWEIYGPAMIRRMVRAGVPRQKAVQSVKDKLPIAREQLQKEMDEGVMVISRAPTLHRYGTMAFRPKLVRGASIRMNPLINKGFGLDFDGDQLNFRALTTEEAKQDAVQKMLPSVNLFSVSGFKGEMNLPSQEYIAGLYQASTSRNTDAEPAVFATTADAVRAFKSGKLGFDRRIKIMESK